MNTPTLIDNQYKVLKLLGEGLSGAVYQVRHGNEIWALKLLKSNPQTQSLENWVDAFKFEFSLLKDISHPHVVRIGDFGWDEAQNSLYFTEELVDGITLDEFLKTADPETAEELFVQCLEGLEAIHQAKAFHGDIKPNNLYVTQQNGKPWVKILDLGIAHPQFQLSAGTPAYFSPEKILKDPVDERSDLYALAVTFYECLTGVNPFKRNSIVETLKAQTSITPADAGSLNAGIRPRFSQILKRLLAKNPRDRFRNATETLAEMDFDRGLEAGREMKAPLVSEKWVGRADAKRAVHDWVKEIKKFGVLFLTGDAGIGKSRLLGEVKYELELGGQTVRLISDPATIAPETKALYLWDPAPSASPSEFEALLEKLKSKAFALIRTADSDSLKTLEKSAKASGTPSESVTLAPMKREDVKELVVLSARDPDPPSELIDRLFEQTKGHPGRTIHLLSALCERNKLLGAHGEWNLALFREGTLSLADSAASPLVFDDLLTQLGPGKVQERADLLLQKSESLLRSRKKDGVEACFAEVEDIIRQLPAGNKRALIRARLLEKKGWKAIQDNNFERAKRELESAKTLFQEMDSPPPELLLRVLNFSAYILIHAGKTEEALQRFEETHAQWKKLSAAQRAKVVNNDLGIALMQMGRYEKAIRILKEYLEFYETLEDTAYRNRCHYNIGECQFQLGAYGKAIQHYQAAADGSRANQQWDHLLRAYYGLGNAASQLKNADTAVGHYQRALDLARYLKDYCSAAAAAQNMGVIQKEMNQVEVARSNLNLSVNLLRQLKEETAYTRHLKARALLELGRLEREESNTERARELLTEARQIIRSEKNLERLFYPVLYTQAQLALDENRIEEFYHIYPDLLHRAKTQEQKNEVDFLRKRSPVDPTQPRELGASKASGSQETAMQPTKSRPTSAPPIAQTLPLAQPLSALSKPDPLRVILETIQRLNSEKNLEALLSMILKSSTSLSGAESGIILLLDDQGELFVASAHNIEVDESLSQVSRKIAEKVLREGRSQRSDNAIEDENFKHYQSVVALGLKSVYCLPIRSSGKVIGVLYLIHRFQLGLFNPETEPVLEAFSDQAGIAIENARLLNRVEEQNEQLKSRLNQAEEKIESYESILRDKKLETRYSYGEIIAQGTAMEKVFKLLDRITSTNLSVLVRGESGTGKELIARALHVNSPRKDKRFIAINCGALPANLIESELFGYKAGAFTGANKDKKGLFEEAQGGTIFLDEIAELDLTLQVKLLRALQEREIVRLGDSRVIPIDVRVVAATLKDVRKLIQENKFREDLYYRVAEIQLEIPPLAERREDIPLLVEHFIKQYSKEHGHKKSPSIDKKLMHLFMNYPWPGNIRELANRVRVACALSDGKTLTVRDLPDSDLELLKQSSPHSETSSPTTEGGSGDSFFEGLLNEKKSWKDIETILMAKALIVYDFDVIAAAAGLDIGQATLYNRLRNEQLKNRKAEFDALPYQYQKGTPLEDIKKEVFALAFRRSDEKPYHAARLLGVSPGMFYKWTE